MSVRRLADEAVQPASFAFNKDNAAWAQKRIGQYPEGRQQSAVIPLLMRAQDQEGWVSRAAIESIADMLGMAYIRVLEVATFYTQFQLQPVGTKAHIQVCGTTPCMLHGAEDLRKVCQNRIHHDAHHLNEAGTLSWEEVECLGACVNAPMVAIGHDTYEDLTPERLSEIIDEFEAGNGAKVPTGPQNGRTFSAPITGFTTLTDVPAPQKAKAPKAATAANDPAAVAPGRMRSIVVEAAPAVAGPSDDGKVSEQTAEAARISAAAAAKANGKPNRAARPAATGAESPAASAAASPAPLFAAPEGQPDDLKMISGVGPVLEKKLNDLGVTKWAQIAAFSPEDIQKLDDSLKFRGRIVRDNWLAQADALATGGREEYVKRFGREPR